MLFILEYLLTENKIIEISNLLTIFPNKVSVISIKY